MFDNFARINPWPSEIIHGRLFRSPSWNEELAGIVSDYCASFRQVSVQGTMTQGRPTNVLMHYRDRECVQKFYRLLELALGNYLNTVGVPRERMSNFRFLTVAALEKRGVFTTPHNHAGAQLVITYYPKVVRAKDEPNPNAGSLVFHPEAGMQFRYWRFADNAFYPIHTETGTLIVFPAHMTHSTFPLYCEESAKYALTTNVRFDYGNDLGPGGEGIYATSAEIRGAPEKGAA